MNMDARTYTPEPRCRPSASTTPWRLACAAARMVANSRSGTRAGGDAMPFTARDMPRYFSGIRNDASQGFESADSASAKLARNAPKGANASGSIARRWSRRRNRRRPRVASRSRGSSPARRHSAHSATCDVSRERHDAEQYRV